MYITFRIFLNVKKYSDALIKKKKQQLRNTRCVRKLGKWFDARFSETREGLLHRELVSETTEPAARLPQPAISTLGSSGSSCASNVYLLEVINLLTELIATKVLATLVLQKIRCC